MANDDGLLLDDSLWEKLFILTNGSISACYQCGECTAICPWGLVNPQGLPVRTILRQAQLGIQQLDSRLWLCTSCGQCQTSCPRGVDIPAIFRALRQIAWEQNHVEKGLPSMLWSLHWNNNPWSQPPSQRSAWANKLNLPVFDPFQHEILLYIGCTSSYNRRAQKIARAIVSLLRTASVPFGCLGDDEPCCGESALSVGHTPYFEEIAEHTKQVFKEKGVKQLITISPHCYDVFKNHYHFEKSNFQPIHYTQYVGELLEEGRLKFSGKLEGKVTFQDPCYLGRLNGEYEAPRRILSAIPGIEIVEMKESRQDGLCCGGGGGRMWLETPAGERFSDIRVQQAIQTGAKYLATACPFCLACLEDSARLNPGTALEVMDIAELAAIAVENRNVGGEA